MRLIDADKLIRKLKQISTQYWLEHKKCSASQMVNDLQDVINNTPTIDLWHYPSKGEYPTDDRRVLCKLRGADNWYECGGYDKDDDTWGFEGFIACGSEVVAWQYILPPKEEA